MSVKFWFLTHNQISRVRDALLDRMKATYTPAQWLVIARTVESTIETEKLSKNFLQNINNQSRMRLMQYLRRRASKAQAASKAEVSNNVATVQVRPKCRNCGSAHPPKKCPVYGKECFLCKKKGHFKQFCQSSQHNRSQSHSSDSRKSRRDMHNVDQQEDELF